MRVGIIDLGTNSIRFSAWELHPEQRQAILLEKKKVMILPGEDVFKKGLIPAKSVKRMKKSLVEFQARAEQIKIEGFLALATCALREAKNSKLVLNQLQQVSSIPIKVISGAREAELIAKGTLRVEPNLRGKALLIDIGGGSTELSLLKDRETQASVSLPLGAQRLQQMFPRLMEQAPTEYRLEESLEVRAFIQSLLKKHLKGWPDWQPTRAYGSSGTIKTIQKLIQRRRIAKQSRLAWVRSVGKVGMGKNHRKFSFDELRQLNQSLLFLTPKQLQQLAGVEKQRRPLITHGALLLEEILLYFSVRQIQSTEGGLREGVVAEILSGETKPRPFH